MVIKGLTMKCYYVKLKDWLGRLFNELLIMIYMGN